MKGNINMSAKEAERIAVMENLISKRIKQKHAARQLDISVRQTQRLIAKYKKDGVKGLTHKSRGRKSNRAINQSEKDRATDLIRKYYPDWYFEAIGFGSDHVHVQIEFPPKYSGAYVIETIKKNTSRALKEKFGFLKEVYWDEGGIWSVGYFFSTISHGLGSICFKPRDIFLFCSSISKIMVSTVLLTCNSSEGC